MASKKMTVNFKVDQEVKDAATKVLDEMGISMSAAIIMFLKQTIAEQQLPFQPKVMTQQAQKIRNFGAFDNWNKGIAEYERGKKYEDK